MKSRRKAIRAASANDSGLKSRGPSVCAIYTRVSTDHGLEQEFNSLDAQREACAAYIESQRHEGWTPVRTRYDDGGFSGGTLDRPALMRLLEAVEQRQVNTVVVYKVDRLTRSLADFARLIELFDAHGVSFVSVTQAFNTTTSMGRLTLNVLLSFAQFEREVAGERIRDKVAASKRKGIWVGGVVPFGYRLEGRKLAADGSEALIVRRIFQRYLELGSMTPLLSELRETGVLTRQRRLATGKVIGGIPFGKGALGHLLKNRTYIGELNHREKSFAGEHEAIVDRMLFDGVQAKLAENRATAEHRQFRSEALLLGKIFDDRGNRMTPSHSNKNGARYRYYVSRALAEGRKHQAGSLARVPAPEVEEMVLNAARTLWPTSAQNTPGSQTSDPSSTDRDMIKVIVDRVIVGSRTIELVLAESAAVRRGEPKLTLEWSKPTNRARYEIHIPGGEADGASLRSSAAELTLKAIAKGKGWADEIATGKVSLEAIAAREGRSIRSVRMTLSLAFLAPAVAAEIAANRLPNTFGLSRLASLPISWVDQVRLFGLGAPTQAGVGTPELGAVISRMIPDVM